MNHQEEQQFYKLLCLSLGLTQEFPVDVDADGWRLLYQTAIRQSLVSAPELNLDGEEWQVPQ